MTSWQPIETAPKDGTPVDLWYEGERLTNYSWEQLSPDNGFFSPNRSGVCGVRNASHWMPIPEAPHD
jgi:hypothetical protein